MRRSSLALVLALALAAPAAAQQLGPSGTNYYEPLPAGACLFYSSPPSARATSGYWSLGCDANGNLRVVLAGTSAISGAVSVSNFPTGFNVNNFPTGFSHTQGGNTQTIDAGGSAHAAQCASGASSACTPIDATTGARASNVYAVLARLTSGSATSCTSLSTSPVLLGSLLLNPTATSTGTITVTFFDEGASPTCAAADAIASNAVAIGANGVANMAGQGTKLATSLGLAYTLSAAPAAGSTIIVTK